MDLLATLPTKVEDLEEFNARLDSLEDSMAVAQERLPSWAKKFMVFLLQVVLSLVVTDVYNRKSGRRLDEIQTLLEEKLTRIETKLPQDRTDGESFEDFMVVTDIVNLRVGPSKDYPVLRKLLPNNIVRPIERRNSWIRVEALVFTEGLTEEGGVYKRYLRPAVDPSNEIKESQ